MKAIKGRVLILDDDVLVAVNYKDYLESHGYACQLAHRIQDAAHFLKHNNFDIVFCDHDLPDGKGINFIKKITESYPDLPFIYMSAASPAVLREAAKINQVKKVLTKPVKEEDILNTLNDCQIEPKLKKRFIGPVERKMLLEIHRDAGSKDKN
jgi:DNA-binding NtrC family response regulator